MIRFYVMPMIRVTVNGDIHRAPKYLRSRLLPSGIACNWSAQDYGLIDACVVGAKVTQAQHTQLAAYPDVAAAPASVDRQIGSALPTVQTILAALHVPSAGITTQHTFRQVLRYLCHLFALAQRHHALHDEPLIDGTVTLDTPWTQIPKARRQRLIATAKTFRYHTANVKADWPMRRILQHLADQEWSSTPVEFGPVRL